MMLDDRDKRLISLLKECAARLPTAIDLIENPLCSRSWIEHVRGRLEGAASILEITHGG